MTFEHGHASEEYVGGFDHEPNAEEAAEFFELDFEPHRGEELTIRLTSGEEVLGIKKP